MKRENINVAVNNRILWIGSQAYPLHNISRAGTVRWEPKRGELIFKYIVSVVLCIAGGILATVELPKLTQVNGLTTWIDKGLLTWIDIAMVVLIAIRTIRLARLLGFTFYELDIETASSSQRVLVSKDGALLTKLVMRITDAINNPQAEFQMSVENFHVGDNINQFGNRNTGKVVS